MTRVGYNGQMAQLFHGRYGAQVKRVARVIGKCAHPPLAQDDAVVALAHDMFGGHEKLVDRGRHAALQKDRL